MKKTSIIVISLIIFVTIGANAQECAQLAQTIGRETQRFGNAEQRSLAQRAQLCTSRYESSSSEQRAQIQGAYGLFSGGASGSDASIRTLQANECRESYGTYWSQQVTSSEINTVSQIGADVVRACLQTTSFRLTDLVLNGEAVVATYRYGGAGNARINGISVQPNTILTGCRALVGGRDYSDFSTLTGTSLPSGETLTLSCSRAANSQSTADRRFFDGGILTIATDAASPSVPLISYALPPIGESDIDSLRRQITELQRRVGVIEDAPLFVYRSMIVSIPVRETIPLPFPDVDFQRNVSSESAPVRTITVQIPGLYFLTGSVFFNEPVNQGYKSCYFTVVPASGSPPPIVPGTQAFNPHCHAAGVVTLNRGDRITFSAGQAGSPGTLAGRAVITGRWISQSR